MSNLGGGEIFAVLLLALIILGPERLPEAARKIGGFVRQVKSMSAGFQDEVRRAVDLGDMPFHPEEARIRPTSARTSQGDTAEAPAGELESEVRARNEDEPEAPDDHPMTRQGAVETIAVDVDSLGTETVGPDAADPLADDPPGPAVP